MTDAEIKTSDLEEMDLPEFDEKGALPSNAELAKVHEILDTSLSSSELSTDLLQIFLRDVASFPLLTAEQEVALARQREDPDPRVVKKAKDALVNHNLRMVMTVANRYHRGRGVAQGIGYLDLIQEGVIGLLRAVELYSLEKLGKNGRPYRFSTYAMWWIRQSIARGLAEKSRNIRVPMHVIEKLGKMAMAEKELHATLGRPPTVEELAEKTDMKPMQVSEILRGTAIPISLSKKDSSGRGDDASDEPEFGVGLEDATTPSPHDIVASELDVSALTGVLATLHPRTLDIIQKRFGLNGEPETSLTDIGQEWGITYQRVRQIEIETLTKLRAHADLQILRDHP